MSSPSAPMSHSLFQYHDADLILRSDIQNGDSSQISKCVDFYVHRCVLSVASSFFETMLSLPQPSGAGDSSMPIIPFPETSAVLETLLRYTYPLPRPSIHSLDDIDEALDAARKYDMTSVTQGLRQCLVAKEFLTSSPLRVYAIASRYDLEDEAKLAANATLFVGLVTMPLHDDLKHLNGYDYHRLLLLHQQRSRSAIALLELPEDVKCMSCNTRRQTADDPPRWWADYKARAKEELRDRPTSAKICSLPFLQQSAQVSGCERCAGSILASFWFFDQLRDKIDALPATI